MSLDRNCQNLYDTTLGPIRTNIYQDIDQKRVQDSAVFMDPEQPEELNTPCPMRCKDGFLSGFDDEGYPKGIPCWTCGGRGAVKTAV